jgi:hypothetical protein
MTKEIELLLIFRKQKKLLSRSLKLRGRKDINAFKKQLNIAFEAVSLSKQWYLIKSKPISK